MSPASGKERPRVYDPVRTRRALIDVALELFGDQGFHSTSVSQLVAQAGLTKGAFYYHFGSKEELLQHIHDEFIDRHIGAQQAIIEKYELPEEQLVALIEDLVQVIADYTPHVTIFFQERRVLKGPEYESLLRKRDQAMDVYRSVIEAGRERGDFKGDLDPNVAALGVLGMCVWMYQWYRPDGPRSVEEIARDFAEMLLRGLNRGP